jgi:hypothetical protein
VNRYGNLANNFFYNFCNKIFSGTYNKHCFRVDGYLHVPLLGDENRKGQAKSIRQGFHAANYHQIVAVSGMYYGVPVCVSATWNRVYSAFFSYLFDICRL